MSVQLKYPAKDINDLIDKAKSGDLETKVDTELSFTSGNAIANSTVTHALADLPTKYGSYPKMSAGFADNLVGRGEATPEQFVYQATANDLSVLDEPAKIVKIKGNSVVWNQIVKPHIFSRDAIDYGFNGLTVAENADGSYTLNGTTTADVFINLSDEVAFKVGEKVALTGMGEFQNFRFYLNGGYGSSLTTDGVMTCTHEGVGSSICFLHVAANVTITNATINPKIVNLTKAYGVGNEPETLGEFYARIPAGLNASEYDKGQIISVKTEALKTVGFNQWDEQWESGKLDYNTGEVMPDANYIRAKNFTRVLPNTAYYVCWGAASTGYVLFYDESKKFISSAYAYAFTTPANCAYIKLRIPSSYGTTYKNDICLNLSHTGYRNGVYEPYETSTLPLPAIGKYFPAGMRSAGAVCDTIEWDGAKQAWVAIQRVGERAYTTGDESNTEVVTDRTVTHYALAAPITVEIAEAFNPSFKVWDFGTEEALASVVSAPFSAEVVYGFNATDNIRTLIERVRALEVALAAVQNN